MELSATRLDTYLTCPLKYRFRYVDGIEPEELSPALAFGSAVHGTVKHFYKHLMAGRRLSTEEAAAAFIQDWDARCTVPIRWNGATPGQMRDQGIGLIRAYIESAPDPVEPIAVEQELRAPLVNLASGDVLTGVILIGILDRVDPGFRPIELKTSGQSYSQFRCDISLQMTIYSYLMAYHHEAERIDGAFEVIVKNKAPKVQRLDTRRDVRDFERMYNTIEQIVHGIDAGLFYPNPSHMFCPGCDFNHECARW